MLLSVSLTREEREILKRNDVNIKFLVEKFLKGEVEDLKKIDLKFQEYQERQEFQAEFDNKYGKFTRKGRKDSEATKRKKSEAMKKYCSQCDCSLSPETKRLIGLAHKGKTISKETREKVSLANKGKKRTPEQCKRIGDAHRGIKHKKHKVLA